MELLRLLLVDDEPHALKRLEQQLRAIPGIEIVGTAKDGDAAIEEARRLKPDLIFLDVQMPGQDGLSVTAQLESVEAIDIVILTAFDHYAMTAFEVAALDYILKPPRADRLRLAIDRARRRRSERAAHEAARADVGVQSDIPAIHVPDRHGGREVPFADIIWIEAARDYVLLHARTRSHMVRITMTELAARLPEEFLRIHRSAFVALREVRRWSVPSRGVFGLILSDDTHITIGPSYLSDVRTALRCLDR
jgi:DNA-binding LytR/AlgR family response regulator